MECENKLQNTGAMVLILSVVKVAKSRDVYISFVEDWLQFSDLKPLNWCLSFLQEVWDCGGHGVGSSKFGWVLRLL